MHSIGTAYFFLVGQLTPLYDDREAAAIAHEVMQFLTGKSKIERLMDKEQLLSTYQEDQLSNIIRLLQKGTPLQYVTGRAWFMGYEYIVNPAVLIPRPETEELVQWIAGEASDHRIFEIGSGSGCIAISLKQLLPAAEVLSSDISGAALAVATANATALGVSPRFLQIDFLDTTQWEGLGEYDIIVSNPPYIPANKREQLHANVRDHEPGLALFVPNNDPLLFYNAIADFGLSHLATRGAIYCEMEASLAAATEAMFRAKGYSTEIRKDMNGHDRMIKAWRSTDAKL